MSQAAHVWTPPRHHSLGKSVERLAFALGRPLDAEQAFAADVLTGVKADGSPATLESAIIAPRQNVKTWLMQCIVLTRLLQPSGDKLAIWSAHLFDTADSVFNDFLELREQHGWLDDLIVDALHGKGDQKIVFQLPGEKGTRVLRFRARAKHGARGLAGDCVALDEAFALLPAHMGALLPILSTRRRALVLYGSSPGLVWSHTLRSIRDRGRKGGVGAPGYVEWCAPGSWVDPGCEQDAKCPHAVGTPGCVMDDPGLWREANIAMAAGRISEDYVRAERHALPPEEFGRERLGWWDDPVTGSEVFPRWQTLVDLDGQWLDGEFVLAFEVSINSEWASVALAGRRDDGRVQLEVLRRERGTGWLVPFLSRAHALHGGALSVAANDYASNAAFFPALERVDIQVKPVTRTELAAGSGWLEQAVANGVVAHLGDPVVSDSMADTVRAPVQDGGWVPSRRKSGKDISAMVALIVAGFTLHSAPTAPQLSVVVS